MNVPRSAVAAQLEPPPLCEYCQGTGQEWEGCGCGPGVKHIVDCGRRPPACGRCRGRGHNGTTISPQSLAATALELYDLAEKLLEDLRLRELSEVQPDVRWIDEMLARIRR